MAGFEIQRKNPYDDGDCCLGSVSPKQLYETMTQKPTKELSSKLDKLLFAMQEGVRRILGGKI